MSAIEIRNDFENLNRTFFSFFHFHFVGFFAGPFAAEMGEHFSLKEGGEKACEFMGMEIKRDPEN